MVPSIPNSPYVIESITYETLSDSKPGVVYTPTVDESGWSCPCADWQYRHRRNAAHQCKHIRRIIERGEYVNKPAVKLGIRRESRTPAGVAGISDLWG